MSLTVQSPSIVRHKENVVGTVDEKEITIMRMAVKALNHLPLILVIIDRLIQINDNNSVSSKIEKTVVTRLLLDY